MSFCYCLFESAQRIVIEAFLVVNLGSNFVSSGVYYIFQCVIEYCDVLYFVCLCSVLWCDFIYFMLLLLLVYHQYSTVSFATSFMVVS